MLKMGPKSIITLAAVFLLSTCIDPYSPKLTGYDSLLVVDGLITDANSSYTVKLSRTFQKQNSNPSKVSDATVFISDDAGNRSFLLNKGDGKYKTDSLEFKGIIGRTYILHVQTREDVEYESAPCLMRSVPDIDSIYFEKDLELVNNGTESQEGIKIYLDSKEGDNNQYYQWAFEETWKFKVPEPKRFNFDMTDSSITAVTDVKEYCWKSRKSDEILIHSIYAGEDPHISKEPIFFIASDKSDRLLIQYSILVRQYSISEQEYDFWNNLKQVNESGGDIFAKQPFEVIGNIKNVNNPEEKVLGFFQVSAEKQKRKNILFNDVAGLDLSFYQFTCERFVKEPFEYSLGPGAPPPTWDDLYSIFCVNSNYYFVEPIYKPDSAPGKFTLYRMVFARPECANCELTGTRSRPDFWVDLN
jgi:Domain of unknown function (DUF4249)